MYKFKFMFKHINIIGVTISMYVHRFTDVERLFYVEIEGKE